MRMFLLALTASLLAAASKVDHADNPYEEDYEAFGEQDVSVPLCEANEFLTSNGTSLLCRTLPDVGFCDCPDLISTPPLGTAQPTTPLAPLPPPGCDVFSPPIRGAFACLRSPTAIYCSVLCDYRFEFSRSPRNPYYCGEATLFNWRSYPNGAVESSFPECTGFRNRLRLLHPYSNYMPSPCYGLSGSTARLVLLDLFSTLTDSCANCQQEDTFIQCAPVPASAQFYSQVADARNNY